MKLATWNVNSLKVRLPQVLAWLDQNPVDVLALQELKLSDEQFPHAAFAAIGYHAHCFGQKTYNGVAFLSRQALENVVCNLPPYPDPQARVLSACLPTTAGPVRLINGYFVNGQAPDSDKFAYKMAWLAGLKAWVTTQLAEYPRLVLLGDFNIAPEDRDSWDPQGLSGTIHHTEAERAHFQGLLDLGLHDAYRLFEQAAKSYSWWDYRMLGFQKNRGLRIDHILVSSAMKAEVVGCHIDRQPRKNPQPSDHAPVVLEWQGPT